MFCVNEGKKNFKISGQKATIFMVIWFIWLPYGYHMVIANICKDIGTFKFQNTWI